MGALGAVGALAGAGGIFYDGPVESVLQHLHRSPQRSLIYLTIRAGAIAALLGVCGWSP